MLSAVSNNAVERELVDQLAQFYADPLGFVLFAYPWGEQGELKLFRGPDDWQRGLLERVGKEVTKRKFDGINPVTPLVLPAAPATA